MSSYWNNHGDLLGIPHGLVMKTMVMKSPISWDIARIFFLWLLWWNHEISPITVYQTYIIFFNQPRYVLMAQMTPIVTKPHAVWGSSSPGSAMDSPWASRTPRIGATLGRLLAVFLLLWIFMEIFFCCFLDFMDSVAMAPETAILAQIFDFFPRFYGMFILPKNMVWLCY